MILGIFSVKYPLYLTEGLENCKEVVNYERKSKRMGWWRMGEYTQFRFMNDSKDEITCISFNYLENFLVSFKLWCIYRKNMETNSISLACGTPGRSNIDGG